MDKHPLDQAAEIVGSQAALASALGVTKSAVNQWKDEGRRVPAEKCPAIERLTGGRVRCEDLRPDVAWDVLREQVTPAAVPKKSDRATASNPRRIQDETVKRRRAVVGDRQSRHREER
jgi:DNA-binding transcriptional regulator YdaS (Cro superfamily)